MAEHPTTPPTPPTRSTPPVRQAESRPSPAKSGDGDFDAIAADMERTRAAHDGGTYGQLLAEVAPQPEPEPTPEIDMSNVQAVYPLSGQLPAPLRPAAMAEVPPPPGVTPKGGSTEVTSRHPDLVAATMAEMAAETSTGTAGEEADASDPLAQPGASEGFKNHLRVKAAELNGERLATARAKLATSTPAAQAAIQEAVEAMQALAAGRKPQATSEAKK
jgi:hypothetical protein